MSDAFSCTLVLLPLYAVLVLITTNTSFTTAVAFPGSSNEQEFRTYGPIPSAMLVQSQTGGNQASNVSQLSGSTSAAASGKPRTLRVPLRRITPVPREVSTEPEKKAESSGGVVGSGTTTSGQSSSGQPTGSGKNVTVNALEARRMVLWKRPRYRGSAKTQKPLKCKLPGGPKRCRQRCRSRGKLGFCVGSTCNCYRPPSSKDIDKFGS